MREQIDEIISQHPREQGSLIPVLQQVQERFGYLPEEAMQEVADRLRVPESMVFGVATFYAQFKFTPSGRHIVRVCRGTACHVRGGPRILREVERHLGIRPGETTLDFEYTLETVACIGACALAPTMVIDRQTCGQMTAVKVREAFAFKEGRSV